VAARNNATHKHRAGPLNPRCSHLVMHTVQHPPPSAAIESGIELHGADGDSVEHRHESVRRCKAWLVLQCVAEAHSAPSGHCSYFHGRRNQWRRKQRGMACCAQSLHEVGHYAPMPTIYGAGISANMLCCIADFARTRLARCTPSIAVYCAAWIPHFVAQGKFTRLWRASRPLYSEAAAATTCS
jgi:hypothetical protein